MRTWKTCRRGWRPFWWKGATVLVRACKVILERIRRALSQDGKMDSGKDEVFAATSTLVRDGMLSACRRYTGPSRRWPLSGTVPASPISLVFFIKRLLLLYMLEAMA